MGNNKNPIQHGTDTCYNKNRCRRPECVEAKNKRRRQNRRNEKAFSHEDKVDILLEILYYG